MILTILRILYLRLRNNPTELLLVFVMPVIFFSIFAGIFSNGIATGSDKKLRVGWIVGQSTTIATELRQFLDSNSLLDCVSLVSGEGSETIDAATMTSLILEAQRSGKYDLIVKIPPGSPGDINGKSGVVPIVVALVTDGQNPMAVSMVTSIVRGFFVQKEASAVAAKLANMHSGNAAPAEDESADAARFGRQTAPADLSRLNQGSDWIQTDPQGVHRINGEPIVPSRWAIEPDANRPRATSGSSTILADTSPSASHEPTNIVVENPQAASQENPRIAMYAAGIAVLFLLFSATGNAAALLEEAESGTLDRILVSKAGLFHIVSGKWLGIWILGCLQITVMFLWAEGMFRIQLFEHLAGFAVMTFSTAAATASFAMLLATVCKSRAQLNAASVVIILSMSAVGGSMIPRFAMSERMKKIGKWTFNAWALDGYQKVFWFQSPVSSLRMEVTVLLGSSLVLGLMTLVLSRRWKKGSF
ncbi:MAG: ABC transporter permease [Planctomycetaceae bacterium]